MGDFTGTIIKESLEDKTVLDSLKTTKIETEKVTERFKTPWLEYWNLYHVVVPEAEGEELAKALSQALESEHPWYADFKNESVHYIIFKDKIFTIERHDAEGYEQAQQYGIKHGIPPHQVEFSRHVRRRNS